MSNLLPCPFCGGNAIMEKHGINTEYFSPMCADCGAVIQYANTEYGKAAAMWNRRAAASAGVVELADLNRQVADAVVRYYEAQPGNRRADALEALWRMGRTLVAERAIAALRATPGDFGGRLMCAVCGKSPNVAYCLEHHRPAASATPAKGCTCYGYGPLCTCGATPAGEVE